MKRSVGPNEEPRNRPTPIPVIAVRELIFDKSAKAIQRRSVSLQQIVLSNSYAKKKKSKMKQM